MRAAQKEQTSLSRPLQPRSNAGKRAFSTAGASGITKSFLSRVERDLPMQAEDAAVASYSAAAGVAGTRVLKVRQVYGVLNK